MNGRTAAEVSLGVAGIYLLASSVPACTVIVAGMLTNGSVGPFFPWVGMIGPAATAVCAIVLLVARRRLAAWLCANADQSSEATTPDALHAAAISVIGILLLAGGLAEVAREEAVLASHFQASRSLGHYAEAIVSIVMGLLLFFGSRGVVGLWHAARHVGRPRDS